MLAGYEIKAGVIHQIQPERFHYTYAYIQRYETLPTRDLSLIRTQWLRKHLGRLPGSVLDFGAGTGAFLKSYNAESGASVHAYDIVDYPLPEPIQRVLAPTLHNYELITFYDSLEHLESLDILGQIRCPYLCISVPWCHYLSDEWLRNWKHLKPNEHIWHFDQESLANVCRRHGFAPMAFDCPEDQIRRPSDGLPNILSTLFKNELLL